MDWVLPRIPNAILCSYRPPSPRLHRVPSFPSRDMLARWTPRPSSAVTVPVGQRLPLGLCRLLTTFDLADKPGGVYAGRREGSRALASEGRGEGEEERHVRRFFSLYKKIAHKIYLQFLPKNSPQNRLLNLYKKIAHKIQTGRVFEMDTEMKKGFLKRNQKENKLSRNRQKYITQKLYNHMHVFSVLQKIY